MIMHSAAMNASYSEYTTATYTPVSLSMESPLSTNNVATHDYSKSPPFVPELDCQAISVYHRKRADDQQPVPVMQPILYDHTLSTTANSIWITLTSTSTETQSPTAAKSKSTESSNQEANMSSEQDDETFLLYIIIGLLFGFIAICMILCGCCIRREKARLSSLIEY